MWSKNNTLVSHRPTDWVSFNSKKFFFSSPDHHHRTWLECVCNSRVGKHCFYSTKQLYAGPRRLFLSLGYQHRLALSHTFCVLGWLHPRLLHSHHILSPRSIHIISFFILHSIHSRAPPPKSTAHSQLSAEFTSSGRFRFILFFFNIFLF